MEPSARSSRAWVRDRQPGGTILSIALAASLLAGPAAAQAPGGEGTIAYVSSDRSAIHLVAPDGSDDRVAWSVPAGTVYGIQQVAWSRDGSRLAMSSGHEALCSIYQYDLYTLRPDGSDLARVTNAPACADLAALPWGTVSVEVQNLSADESQLFVYVAGAQEPKLVTLASGYQQLVVFPQVADLGDAVQQSVVAFDGEHRWFSAATSADVIPGDNADAGTLTVDASPITSFGALTVSWNPVGDTLAFQLGQGAPFQVAADPASGGIERPLFDLPSGESVLANDITWSPVSEKVLYERFDTNPWTVSLATVDGTDPGREIVTVPLTHGISWLPDGSAFVVSSSDSLLTYANLFLVDAATGSATQLTAEADRFAYWPSVSPDGAHIAYTLIEGPTSAPTAVELRVMGIAGDDDHAIARDAIMPSWGPAPGS